MLLDFLLSMYINKDILSNIDDIYFDGNNSILYSVRIYRYHKYCWLYIETNKQLSVTKIEIKTLKVIASCVNLCYSDSLVRAVVPVSDTRYSNKTLILCHILRLEWEILTNLKTTFDMNIG